jgi:hydrogenase maturation factor
MNRETMLQPLPPGKLPPWLLRKILPAASEDPSILVGPGLGRDAAAIAVGDRVVVAKNDPITFVSENGAEHLVEVNANDIACLGGTPRWLMVTALLPVSATPASVLTEFASLREACRRRAIDVIGGHTEIVPGLDRPILVGMMLGEAAPDDLLVPGQARPGDALLLTKSLAIEGTAILARECGDALRERIGDSLTQSAASLLHEPGISVVRDATLARAAGGVTALHDPTEGGLATAVRELGAASGTGAELDLTSIPILPETRAVADALGIDPLGMLASGSLLITADRLAVPAVARSLAADGIKATVIGELTAEAGEFTVVDNSGRRPLPEFAVDEIARILAARSTGAVDPLSQGR